MDFHKNSNIIINEWAGRLGNNLMQLSNAIHIAKKFECKLNFRAHPYLSNNELNYSNKRLRHFHISRFYDRVECRGFYPTLHERFSIFQEDIKEHLLLNLEHPIDSNDEELVIHMRAGDMFADNPPPKYVPTPLAFFEKIIDDFSYKKVRIVSEDDKNPCIEALLKKYPFVIWQCSDLETDMRTLCQAKNLCVTIGTFGLINVLLSKNLKNLYVDNIPQGILDFGFFKPENHNLPFDIHQFLLQDYIPYRHWRKSLDQLSTVLNYQREKIIYRPPNLFNTIPNSEI